MILLGQFSSVLSYTQFTGFQETKMLYKAIAPKSAVEDVLMDVCPDQKPHYLRKLVESLMHPDEYATPTLEVSTEVFESLLKSTQATPAKIVRDNDTHLFAKDDALWLEESDGQAIYPPVQALQAFLYEVKDAG